jgi:hypothetical protein
MKVLSSKRFFIPKTTTAPWDVVKAWYDSIDRGLGDCTLVVTLQEMGVARQQKKTALRQLEELVVDGEFVWTKFGYRFGFMARKYLWNDKEIHITANEALYLYRWLVLNDDTHKVQGYYLSNMRKRLGKEFLSEVAE